MAPRSPERSARHSAAAHAMWAKCPNRAARLANAHAGRDRQIAEHYGIPAELEHSDPAAYAARLESAKKAWYTSLALKSAKARRKAKAV